MITWNTDADMPPAAAQAEKAAAEAVRWGVRDALEAAGPAGLTNLELYARFGPSAVKRLNDLKCHHGYRYTRQFEGPRTWRYVLLTGTTPVPLPAAPITSRMVSEAARILARAGRARRRSSSSVAAAPEPQPGTLF